MQNIQRHSQLIISCRAFITGLLLFLASTHNAVAGGYHYGHGYYGHGYHSHYGFHAHYSSHGDIGTGGYIVLGLLGAVILGNILNYDDRDYSGTYHRSNTYQAPTTYYNPPPSRQITYQQPAHTYRNGNGWNALTEGNAEQALDIFAVQSQQNLNSGIPRIGFALAAAANNELDRGSRAMRKAISMDPDALNTIYIDERLDMIIDILDEEYNLRIQQDKTGSDDLFMIAVLSYLKEDYVTTKNMITNNDFSQSIVNLRKLVNKKLQVSTLQ